MHEAARTRTRRLILVTGVPGAGKTLVGLRAVHAHYLDDLSVPRVGGKPTAPAVFLSGNGPLVEVLQYELRNAGGSGKVFVRDVREYVRRYSRRRSLIPPEHVLVFDEAQRAWDRDRVAEKHSESHAKSEPEHFIEFAMRIPEWCAVIGLIGGGQEIHTGEEAGLVQWRDAVERCVDPGQWVVHGTGISLEPFSRGAVTVEASRALDLDAEIRFHLATDVHAYVTALLDRSDVSECRRLAERLEQSGYHLRITRDFDRARQYLWDRYGENPTARFGLVASSRDRELRDFGIANDWQATKRVRHGPWYGDGEESPSSCRHLRVAITEFGAQGLELDAVLLAWGTDLMRKADAWTNERARKYRGAVVHDPFRLRLNAYRVLLTRARDANVIFVPPVEELDETAEFLANGGVRRLD